MLSNVVTSSNQCVEQKAKRRLVKSSQTVSYYFPLPFRSPKHSTPRSNKLEVIEYLELKAIRPCRPNLMTVKKNELLQFVSDAPWYFLTLNTYVYLQKRIIICDVQGKFTIELCVPNCDGFSFYR